MDSAFKPFVFAPQDFSLLKEKGIAPETVLKQIEAITRGAPFVKLIRPCVPGMGLHVLDSVRHEEMVRVFLKEGPARKITKFVPGSGAGSRMFQSLLSLIPIKNSNFRGASLEQRFYSHSLEPRLNLLETKALEAPPDPDARFFKTFLEHIKEFPFYEDLESLTRSRGKNLETLIAGKQYAEILELIVGKLGLNYGDYPKALLKFHRYPDHCRTPLEEQCAEALDYALSENGTASLHFTFSPEHLSLITDHIKKVRPRYETGGKRLDISWSIQKESTETIALDKHHQPLRDENTRLVFRPGGHGALLENLNELQGDIVFIKNIDNVVPDFLKEDTLHYKKVLGGYLVSLQKKIFAYLRGLEKPCEESFIKEVFEFLEKELSIKPPQELSGQTISHRRGFLFSMLNRPLRVCGMVKNQGEPGGQPFWVEQPSGIQAIAIVESFQINYEDKDQKRICQSSTHFNPVDLVCGVRDYLGQPFDLTAFRDETQNFISHKSWKGREAIMLELPGLWNGSMAFWNTVFVEVPLSTFNPVKTVLDLLRKEHKG